MYRTMADVKLWEESNDKQSYGDTLTTTSSSIGSSSKNYWYAFPTNYETVLKTNKKRRTENPCFPRTHSDAILESCMHCGSQSCSCNVMTVELNY